MRFDRKFAWPLLAALLTAVLVAVLAWLVKLPVKDPGSPSAAATRPAAAGPPLRIGLVPERDIFRLRQQYQGLAGYLSARLGRPVEWVTVSTYEAVLLDFQEKKIEGAFLGSLVAVLAMDRLGAQVIAKPEFPGQVSTYCGVIFVRADSPITRVKQLGGQTMAMVRTTTAGNLFPVCVLTRCGLWTSEYPCQPVWVGTHDDVVREVMAGRVGAGAAKDLRVDDMLAQHKDWKIRRLTVGKAVPNNALVLRADMVAELGPKLSKILLGMHEDPDGAKALASLGAVRFLPCRTEEFQAIYDMVSHLGESWRSVGVSWPAPRRPACLAGVKVEPCCDGNS
jgi:phosphate/phosphite/phosphonate ABC transporter binding protein